MVLNFRPEILCTFKIQGNQLEPIINKTRFPSQYYLKPHWIQSKVLKLAKHLALTDQSGK